MKSHFDRRLDAALLEMGMSSSPMSAASLSDAGFGTDMNDALSSTEIRNQADDIATDDTEDQVADEMRAEQEKEQAEKEQRQKMLRPQMDMMDKSIRSIGQDAIQGGVQSDELGQTLGGMDSDVDKLKMALQSFEKAAL